MRRGAEGDASPTCSRLCSCAERRPAVATIGQFPTVARTTFRIIEAGDFKKFDRAPLIVEVSFNLCGRTG